MRGELLIGAEDAPVKQKQIGRFLCRESYEQSEGEKYATREVVASRLNGVN